MSVLATTGHQNRTLDRTLPPTKLRPYQLADIEAGDLALAGKRRPTATSPYSAVNRIVSVIPTGGGKTVVFVSIAARTVRDGRKVLILVHREELAQQAFEKAHSAAPGARIGIVKAGRNDVDADIIIASVPTLARLNRRSQITNVGLVIVDEAHHVAADTWRATIEHFGGFGRRWVRSDPRLGEIFEECDPIPVRGYTATLSRQDNRDLGGKDGIFQEVVTRIDITEGIRDKWLVDVRGKRIQVENLDLDDVRRTAGEMQVGDLGRHLEDANAGNAVAKAIRDEALACGYLHPAVFTPTVASAHHFAEELILLGITAEVITGETPIEEREAIQERFRTGETRVLVNCMVLTEGWDAPWCDCVVIARPTESAALYVQMVGRALRPFPEGGKKDALVLDVVGISTKIKLATLAELTGKHVSQVRDGESLSEALDREAEGQGFAPAHEVIQGRHVVEEVDLFANSDSMWLATEKGTWFIPVAEGTFIVKSDKKGTFIVGRLPKNGRAKYMKNGRYVSDVQPLERGMTLELGMRWAERYATDEDPSLSSKNAPWRKKNEPSLKQMEILGRMKKVYGEDFSTRSEASNLISVSFAQRSGL